MNRAVLGIFRVLPFIFLPATAIMKAQLLLHSGSSWLEDCDRQSRGFFFSVLAKGARCARTSQHHQRRAWRRRCPGALRFFPRVHRLAPLRLAGSILTKNVRWKAVGRG